jgi:uncharacterized membrane protein
MNIYKYLAAALGACLIFSMGGCKIVRAIGETAIDAGEMVGIGVSDKEDSESAPNPNLNESNSSEAAEEGSQLAVGAFVIVFILFSITLAVRYFYFKNEE